MKLNSIELHPYGSTDVFAFSFRDPSSTNPYILKDATGLDAGDITPQYYPGANGAKFHNLALQKRQIVLKIGLNPNFSVNDSYSSLRDSVYKAIAASRYGKVQVHFKDATGTVAIVWGTVVKYETAQFQKTQDVVLTIDCDTPMLTAPGIISVANISSLNPLSTVVTDDISTAPHGITVELNVTAPMGGFAIDNPDDQTWFFWIVYDFLLNDKVYFSSELNNKYIYIIRGTNAINVADKIQPGSLWPIMFPGANKYRFSNNTDLAWISFSYYPTFWGV